MKFKINKKQFAFLSSFFDNGEKIGEIELEPSDPTAAQMIYEQDVKAKAYEQGLDRGYREGWYAKDACRCSMPSNRSCCYQRNHPAI